MNGDFRSVWGKGREEKLENLCYQGVGQVSPMLPTCHIILDVLFVL